MLVDGLVRATDNTPRGNEALFAQIRPANPEDTDWTLGYVQSRYVLTVSLVDTHAQTLLFSKVSSKACAEIGYFAETECTGKIGYPT